MWNKNEPSNNIWRTRDVAEIAAAIKTAPIFIDEIKSNGNNFRSVFFFHKFILLFNQYFGLSIYIEEGYFMAFCFFSAYIA
jgi:hypothetical protein